jgi:hypothetical protein
VDPHKIDLDIYIRNMKKKFKIKKYRIFILFLLFSSINTVLAQEYTDQELQFDRAVFRAELLSSGTVSPATIETRIDEIRANLVLKKKLLKPLLKGHQI